MSNPKPPPIIPPEVVAWLEKLFPNELPRDINISRQEFCGLIGQQEVIRALKNELRRQSGDHTVLPF